MEDRSDWKGHCAQARSQLDDMRRHEAAFQQTLDQTRRTLAESVQLLRRVNSALDWPSGS